MKKSVPETSRYRQLEHLERLIQGFLCLHQNTLKSLRKFVFFSELASLLKSELKRKFDIIIHAAAVSDYQLKNPSRKKISSNQREMILRLVPTPKLITSIKKHAPKSFLVGFKLESSDAKTFLKNQAEKLIRTAGCDLVVANSFNNGYHGYIINKNSTLVTKAFSRKDIAQKLLRRIKEQL